MLANDYPSQPAEIDQPVFLDTVPHPSYPQSAGHEPSNREEAHVRVATNLTTCTSTMYGSMTKYLRLHVRVPTQGGLSIRTPLARI